MTNRLEIMPPANLFLCPFDVLAGKLDFPTAAQADEMVVMWVAQDVLEAAVRGVFRDTPNQAAFDKQRQIAIKRCLGKTLAFEPEGNEQIIHREMAVV